MNTFKFLLIVFVASLGGCRKSEVDKSPYERTFQLTLADTLVLRENLEALSDIHSVATFSEGSHAVVSSKAAGIYKYDRQGLQVFKFGAWGEGQFEYGKPESSVINSDTLYVYDSRRRRIIVFDQQGTGLFESWTLDMYDSDFYVHRGQLYRSYSSGLPGVFFSVRDLHNESKEGYAFGKADLPHLAMMIRFGTGQLAGDDEYVWFSTPAKTMVYRYTIANNAVDSVAIADPDFTLADFSFVKVRDDIVADIKRLMHFQNNSSRFIGMHRLDDYVIGEMEHGVWSKNPAENTQYTRLHLLDREMRHVGSISLDPHFRTRYGDRIVGTYGNMVYFVRPAETRDGTDLSWVLYRFAVTSQNLEEAH